MAMRLPPRSLLVPFRRDRKRDFASGSEDVLLASQVRQAILTEGTTATTSGELPWRTSFGAALALLRYQSNDGVLGELARVLVRDALQRWVPRAELLDLEVVQTEATLSLRLHVRANGASARLELALES